METWLFMILISLCISALIKPLSNLLFHSNSKTTITSSKNLPPGPPTIPIIGALQWLAKPMSDRGSIIRHLHAKYGPIVKFHNAIYVATHSLAHQALIQNAATVANRPRSLPTLKIMNSNQHTINTGLYGPIWRALRRNLTSEILQSSRVKSYSTIRKRVLEVLTSRLKSQSECGGPVSVVDHLRPAMFSIAALICFGDNLEEEQIKEIDRVESNLIWSLGRFNILNFLPKISKILFRKRWEELLQLHKNQRDVYVPLIEAREKMKQDRWLGESKSEFVVSYVDTLLEVQIPADDHENINRKLEKSEIVSICSEFLNGITDNTAITLNWIMAYLAKYPHIQEKLYAEISDQIVGSGSGTGEGFVREEDLQKMSYLRAVVLEALRLHPALHFLLPHAATEDVLLDGYLVPKNTTLIFMVGELGLDPNVWEDPMAFKPERFLTSDRDRVDNRFKVFDITSHAKEIKMMPFGAGKRMCPGYGLAMLHLEYIVANLVWSFKWTAVDGIGVDLSEKRDIIVMMKNPLRAHISPRLTT